MTVFNWEEHCPYEVHFTYEQRDLFLEAIQEVVSINTCFMAETSEHRLHTTERGVQHLEAWMQAKTP